MLTLRKKKKAPITHLQLLLAWKPGVLSGQEPPSKEPALPARPWLPCPQEMPPCRDTSCSLSLRSPHSLPAGCFPALLTRVHGALGRVSPHSAGRRGTGKCSSPPAMPPYSVAAFGTWQGVRLLSRTVLLPSGKASLDFMLRFARGGICVFLLCAQHPAQAGVTGPQATSTVKCTCLFIACTGPELWDVLPWESS